MLLFLLVPPRTAYAFILKEATRKITAATIVHLPNASCQISLWFSKPLCGRNLTILQMNPQRFRKLPRAPLVAKDRLKIQSWLPNLEFLTPLPLLTQLRVSSMRLQLERGALPTSSLGEEHAHSFMLLSNARSSSFPSRRHKAGHLSLKNVSSFNQFGLILLP